MFRYISHSATKDNRVSLLAYYVATLSFTLCTHIQLLYKDTKVFEDIIR